MWYIIISLVVSILAISGYNNKKTGIYITLLLLFLSMFRGENVGHDTKGYMDTHEMYLRAAAGVDIKQDNIGIEQFGTRTELIANVINELVYNKNLPPRLIIYFYSIITIVFLFYAFKRFRVNIALGMMFYVLLGLYFFSLTAARQMAAVSIVAFGISYIFDESKKKYLFFVMIITAALIHASALYFVWLYFIRYIKFKRMPIIVVCAIICLIFTALPIDIMGTLYSLGNMDYITRYRGTYDQAGKHIFKIIFGLFFLVYYYYWIIIRNKEAQTDKYDNIYLIALLLNAMFSSYSILIARVSFYLTVFLCVYLSKELYEKQFKYRSEMYVFTVMFILMKVYFAKDWLTMLESDYYLMF